MAGQPNAKSPAQALKEAAERAAAVRDRLRQAAAEVYQRPPAPPAPPTGR